jgi:isoleucyl-tRNA synthetase
MKAVAAAIAAAKEMPGVIEGIEIAEEDVIINRMPKPGLVVASAGSTVVGLETALTPELVAEGIAREFVSHVQSMRNEADFEVTQRIKLCVSTDEEAKASVVSHLDYVKNEVLALSVDWCGGEGGSEIDLNGHKCLVAISTAGA